MPFALLTESIFKIPTVKRNVRKKSYVYAILTTKNKL